MDDLTKKIDIFDLLRQNEQYESCNIEFNHWGGAYDAVDFHPVLETQDQINAIRDLFKGEWVDTDLVCKALNIDFSTGLKMFDFSRTARWCDPPLNGQIITTKFKLKKEKDDEQ